MKRLSITAVALLSIAGFWLTIDAPDRASAQSGSRGGFQDNRSFEDRFWSYLKSQKYENWAPVPGQSDDFYKGESPHGAYLKMYLNRTAAGNSKKLPSGSIIIKENYGPDKKTLMAVTVMYRSKGYNPSAGDWYWVKYNPDGTVAKAPPEKGSVRLAGKPKGCILCHDGADGKDFSFFND